MIVDLRSDTVTKPTKGMLDAMFSANVGDDVFGEDLTVLQLEEKAANLFGMQAGLFCPSGTMTNQIAIRCYTQPGDELICDETAHIYNYEGGGISSNSGVQARLIKGDRGRLTAEQVKEYINDDFDWLAKTTLVCLENTVNKAGGSVYALEQIKAIKEMCAENQLNLHIDGARIFNAITYAKYTSYDIGSQAHSISVCLSKGLGAPIGSVLLGTKAFIKKAKRIRKVFGGGMRQAGYLAAAGIYALDNHIERLSIDHNRAKCLEDELRKLDFVKYLYPVDTNIVVFDLTNKYSAVEFAQKLNAQNIKVSVFGKQTIRLVTHLDFTDDMLNETVRVLRMM